MKTRLLALIAVSTVTYNTYAQCPTTIPVATDSCRIGTGEVILEASGSTNYYSWYDAPVGGNWLADEAAYTTPTISSTTNYYVAARNPYFGLDFDGTNDYVAIDNFFYNTSGMTELTVEAWVRTTSTGNQMVCSFDRSEYFRLSINDYAGPGEVSWSVSTSTGIEDLQGNTSINDGDWHHLAGVFDNGTMSIYVDGVLDATTTTGATWGDGVTRYGFIGTGSEATSFNGAKGPTTEMNGEIDEVRIWSVARTPPEIQNSMFVCLDGFEAGLEAYFKLDEASGSSVSSEVGLATGTLFNMDASTDWIENDRELSCPSCESSRATAVASVAPGTPLDLGLDQFLSCSPVITLDGGVGYTNYLWSTAETTPSIDVVSAGEYILQVDNGAACYDFDTVNVFGQGGSSETTLVFDGSNDYIAIDDYFYNSTGLTQVTVEAWIKTTSGGNQIIASYDRSEYWRLGINGNGAGTGQVCWNVRTNLGIFDFGSTTRVDDGLWHHVAGVFDNGIFSIYIDGVLDAQTISGSTFGSGVTRYGFISSGSEATGFNGGRTPANEMNGNIDDLRIWSVARTADQIRANMCQSNVADGTGLEQYWDLNEGTGFDVSEKVNSYEGTLFNMTTTDWQTSGAPIGNESVYLYPGSWSGESLNLISCSGDEVTLLNVTGTPTGLHLYVVEGDPNSTSGITNLTSGNHYYGVFMTEDGTEDYDVVYTYTDHPLLPNESENAAILFERLDNATNTWEDNGSTVNSETDELLGSRTGRNEIIVDYVEYVWDGSSNTDWGTAANWTPASVPPPAAHIRVPDVTNQPVLDADRQVGSFVLEPSSTADLAGFNLSVERDIVHDGVLSANEGTLTFNGPNGDQRFFTNTNYTAEDIVIDNPAQVSNENGHIYLHGSMNINSGTFETSDSLTVVSDALGTGQIGEITGFGLNGEIVMERYIDAGETYWRQFSSAVQGATFEQYNDDFTTAGYPGSLYPAFGWVSAYTYNETLAPGSGYEEVTDASQVIGVGEGVHIWCGDTITGTLPFIVDLRGQANQGPIDLPVTYTNYGAPDEDGFCLIGNPYPSTIDWDASDWIKSNMANAVYIQDPDTETYATYIAGAGANGGSRYIASQQSFWVQAIGTSPTLQINEGCKSSFDAVYFKSGESLNPGSTIRVEGFGMSDECVIRHEAGTVDEKEWEWDADKLWGAWGVNPQISFVNSEAKDLTVHTFDFGYEEWSVPLRLIVFETGEYTLEFSNLEALDIPCLKIEDTYTGELFDISEGELLTFELYDTTWAPRFLLHLGKKYESEVADNLCPEGMEGEIQLDLNQSTVFFQFIDGSDTLAALASGNPLVFSDLAEGPYEVIVPGLDGLCEMTNFSFFVSDPADMVIYEEIEHSTGLDNGSIEVEVLGGTAGYTYWWNTGSTLNKIDELGVGDYELMVTDNNGCQKSESYSIKSVASIDEISAGTVYYNAETHSLVFNDWTVEEGYQLRLLNALGQVVYEGSLTTNSHFNLQLPNLSAGVYILESRNLSEGFKFSVGQ